MACHVPNSSMAPMRPDQNATRISWSRIARSIADWISSGVMAGSWSASAAAAV